MNKMTCSCGSSVEWEDSATARKMAEEWLEIHKGCVQTWKHFIPSGTKDWTEIQNPIPPMAGTMFKTSGVSGDMVSEEVNPNRRC